MGTALRLSTSGGQVAVLMANGAIVDTRLSQCWTTNPGFGSQTYIDPSNADLDYADMALAAQGAELLERSEGVLERLPLLGPYAGASPRVLAFGLPSPQRLVTDGTHIWFTNGDGTIRRIGVDGTGLATLVAGESAPGPLGCDATSLYWFDQGNGTLRQLTPKRAGEGRASAV